jgi:predicted neuraminidase
MPVFLRILLAALAIVLGFIGASLQKSGFGEFVVENVVEKTVPRPSVSLPIFKPRFLNIDPSNNLPMVHVASPVLYPGGLATVWYGGSRECAPDVKIYFSKDLDAEPVVIMTRERAEKDLGRPVQSVGNAVLIAEPNASLRLLFVTIGLGKWSGSQLNTSVSTDGGITWSRAERLTLSPFFNFSELVRNRPLQLTGGGWCVPMYQEFLGKFPELLWLAKDGSYRKSRIAGGCTSFQPSVVPLDNRRAIALMRDYTPTHRIHLARTEDGGHSWTNPAPTSLLNPDAGISAVRLSDGRILLSYNDSATNRKNLSWAVSQDDGITWTKIGFPNYYPTATFAYPYLMRQGDYLFQAFTADGKLIELDSFNEAFLDEKTKDVSKP